MNRNLMGMNRLAVGALALGLLAGVMGGHVAAQNGTEPTKYDQGNPTDSEQYLLQKLYLSRRDPVGEGARLKAYLTCTNTGKEVVVQYGVSPSQVASDFAALPAVPPLAFNADLLAASEGHADDLAAHGGGGPGGNDHAGYDGSTPDSRVYASGFRAADGSDGFSGENVGHGLTSLDDQHAGYFVDWGNPGYPHRALSMNGSNAMNVVGIGVASMSNGMISETEDYGQPGYTSGSNGLTNANVPAFLTGVVYTDKNGNGQYDVGEGVAGITVSMDGGAYYAVTTSSGGYSLPLVNLNGSNATGTVVVRMSALSGESAGRTAVVNVTSVSTQYGSYRANVEWDVVPGQPSAGVSAGPALAPFFNGSAALGTNWYYLAFDASDYFGYFNVSHYPYVYHIDLGWEYVLDANDGKAGVYLYDFDSASWFYTSPSYKFPYLYSFKLGATVYYFPKQGEAGRYDSDPRYFYNFKTKLVVSE